MDFCLLQYKPMHEVNEKRRETENRLAALER